MLKRELEPRYIGIDIVDQYECPCGWKSKPYYDGAEYAYAEWKRHAERCGKVGLWAWAESED